MSIITIQCRLVAREETLRYLWDLMAQKNTPLINEVLNQIGQHPDFETWLQQGRLPAGFVKTLVNSLRTEPPFVGQPGRFYYGAIALIDYLYKSWFALQQRRQRQIEGKERWLSMLKSDAELEKECNSDLEMIRAKAAEILFAVTDSSQPVQNQPSKGKKGKKSKTPTTSRDAQSGKPNKQNQKLFNSLFDSYSKATDSLEQCALAYLLKNNCQLSDSEENPEEFTQKRRKKEIEIERLKQQLQSRLPKGRDLTGEKWLEVLDMATNSVPQNEGEAAAWQAALLRKTPSVPFQVAYETSEDMTWFKNQQGRICVWFNGLKEHAFEVWCDKRQLHWFQRFLEDQQTKRDSKNQHSSGLFSLRSGRLSWQERQGKGSPWQVNRLILYCAVDTRLWTKEGSQQIAAEKAAKISKIISKTEEKGELNPNQQAFLKRQQSTLARINNPFPRPSKPLYQGQSHILVGVSFGLDKPATVAVVDALKGEVLTYRSIKQLLGDNYKLLNRQRQQQQTLAHQRHKAQKQNAPNQLGESELGQYVDRLLAKAIVAIAKTYQAGSIVLPKLSDMREIVQSEVQTRAEQKVPGFKEGQQQYAKQYRVSVHRWSYGRLSESISQSAAKTGIPVEVGQQSIRGSPQQQALDLAITAYYSRTLC
ncbi:type V CRISPR-associated protein Cas12k [Lyngbya aestuarii]|uniref:type V CRISPR-associated protein Cas12k n=1 Tax=Lyngbya aestuarii TaxID=118322 RepID=UPI00403D8561